MRNSEKDPASPLRLLHLIFLGSLSAFASCYKIGLGDFWMHLAQGLYIIDYGAIPSIDVFSYTFAGKPWVNWEWFHNVLVAIIWRAAGAVGVEIFRMAVFGAVIVVLYRLLLHVTNRPTLSFFIACWSLLMIQLRIVDRPHILSYLFLALLLFLLRDLATFSRRTFLLLAVVLALWRNSHPSWVLGCAVVFACLVDRFISLRRAGQSRATSAMILWFFVLLLIGIFATPLPLQVSGHLELQSDQSIAEWGSLLTLRREMWGLEIWLFFLFSLLSLVIVPRVMREHPAWVVLFLAMLGNAYLHFRFIPEAVILGVPLVASALSRQGDFRLVVEERLLGIFLFCLTLFGSGEIFRDAHFPARGFGIDERFVPVHAAEFARRSGLSGNFYGTYPFSMDFLMGYLYPHVKVALDARVPGLYPFSFADAHWHITTVEQFREQVLSLPADYVLLGNVSFSPPSPREPVLELLLLQEGFDLIYFDSTSALYRSPRIVKEEALPPFTLLARWNTDEEVLKKAATNDPNTLFAEVRRLKEYTAGRDDFYREVLIFLYTRPSFSEEQRETLEEMYAQPH